ncbi:FKBP-type peptidyl-prolyl cis-trans isomerase [uncultured Georgenia sp.]|uniref:FKBP-type peptidyl-prolyl cis-trans isomerase n=1 Tax=uncultured Georgenia sp. TaxID=378209 RepID=UPI0026141783|nr:FKBP-type peptidyl-prolyl cis-trans isomerase [uncultured Georgenia sp.]HLV05983.1 FKBP-type peptidyl-prolyl cis-trans isomerase [Actinomycetaceae bacterium]
MRRSVTATAATALAAVLFLAGCSDDGDPEPTDTATESATDAAEQPTGNAPEDVAALEGITVEGEPGAEPRLTFEQPLNVGGHAAAVAVPGDGATLEEGQLLLIDFIQVNGENGEVLDSTYGAGMQPLIIDDDVTVEALNDVLVGQQVGARVLFASPTQGPAAIMAIEVREAVSSRAEGTEVETPEGLPTVTRAENGEPSIEPVDGEAPTELVTAATIEGEGKAVEEGDQVFAQYSGWLWDGTQFDSSWTTGVPLSFEVGAGELIQGWDTGIVGHTVGSQVLFVIPPDLGYGEEEVGPIPGGSTLVFVVDILYAG